MYIITSIRIERTIMGYPAVHIFSMLLTGFFVYIFLLYFALSQILAVENPVESLKFKNRKEIKYLNVFCGGNFS